MLVSELEGAARIIVVNLLNEEGIVFLSGYLGCWTVLRRYRDNGSPLEVNRS
jgi:hypothetical protein